MTTLVATPYPAGSPAPYVDLAASAFTVGAVTVTVWRQVQGRSFAVRGLVNQSASGSVTGLDFEAPLGIDFTYRVQEFNSSGGHLAWSNPVTVRLDGPSDRYWIHNPIDPSTSLRLRLLSGDVAAITRPVAAEVFRVLGRSVGVALFSTRHGVEQVVLDTMTESTVDAAKFDALFGGYNDVATVPIVCIRLPAATRLPSTFYALIQNPQQLLFDVHTRGEIARWALVADEIAPPPAAIVSSLLDYADFTAFYADYAAYTAAYPDYQTAQRDYSISGAA